MGARRSSQGSNERKSRANKWRSVFLGEWEIRAISCSRRDQTGGRERVFLTEREREREKRASLGEKTGVQMRRKFARRVFRLMLRRSPSYFYFASLSSFSVASRISSRAFRPRSHQLPVRGREKLQRQVGRGELRSRVTNHLSRGARFRSTPKRGERWNCNDSKNALRPGNYATSQLNLCQPIQCSLMRKVFWRIFSLYVTIDKTNYQ